jgi:hypothetical protein
MILRGKEKNFSNTGEKAKYLNMHSDIMTDDLLTNNND